MKLTTPQADYLVVAPPDPDIDPAALMRLLTEEEQNQLAELGRINEESRWALGNGVLEKVEQLHWPVRQTCIVFATLAKRNRDRVRTYFYCSRFYVANPKLFQKYGDMDWAILNFARKTEQPSLVLSKAAMFGYSLEELKVMFPAEADPPETQKALKGYPIYVKPMVRWLRLYVKHERWGEVESLMSSFLAHVRELVSE